MVAEALTTLSDAEVDEWLAHHRTRDRARSRDVLAPLTWRQWCVWQAWAVCGCSREDLPEPVLLAATSRLLTAVEEGTPDNPKRDQQVPVLPESELFLALDDEQVAVWLNHYIHDRPIEYLAARRDLVPVTIERRLGVIRPLVQVLLPPDCIGAGLADAQCELTL